MQYAPGHAAPTDVRSNRRRVCVVAAAVLTTAVATLAPAADRYWDINGTTVGAGGSAPTGSWGPSFANWTADFDGASATETWTDGSVAVFAAGTDATGSYTVTIDPAQSPVVAGIRVEEGA